MVKVGLKRSGGRKLQSFLDKSRKNVRALAATRIEAGFFDPRAAALARIHEFGLGDAPERPAMRLARPAFIKTVRKGVKASLKGSVTKGAFRLTGDGAQRIAGWAAAALKREYLIFSHIGAPKLGPVQVARKAGTEGQGRLLIGSEGPRLIEHIQGRVTRR